MSRNEKRPAAVAIEEKRSAILLAAHLRGEQVIGWIEAEGHNRAGEFADGRHELGIVAVDDQRSLGIQPGDDARLLLANACKIRFGAAGLGLRSRVARHATPEDDPA